MNTGIQRRRFALAALAAAFALAPCKVIAQGPPQDQNHRDDRHDDRRDGNRDNRGGPDQSRDNRGYQGRPNGNGQPNRNGQSRYDNRGGPQQNYRFGNDDRNRFNQHYQSDAIRWRNRRDRPRFYTGYAIPRNYAIRAVPPSYWNGGPPPPPGYQYGYYDGYATCRSTSFAADISSPPSCAARTSTQPPAPSKRWSRAAA